MSYFLNYWYRLLHCIDWADAVREAAILPLALQLEMADWNVSLSAANEGRTAPIIIHAIHQFLNNGAPHKASGSLLIEIHRRYIHPPPTEAHVPVVYTSFMDKWSLNTRHQSTVGVLAIGSHRSWLVSTQMEDISVVVGLLLKHYTPAHQSFVMAISVLYTSASLPVFSL